MRAVKRFFLSRITILVLICLAIVAITTAAMVPQEFLATGEALAEWRARHPLLAVWTASIGLHHIYTHLLFAIILGGVLISLSVSCWEQCRLAWRRTFAPADDAQPGDAVSSPLPLDRVVAILTRAGYLPTVRHESLTVCVRHPWGFWGNALLHLGMTVTIAASLLIALTQQRALIHIGQGEVHEPTMPWFMEEHGLLARPLALPFAVRLDRLDYAFWPTHGVKDVTSTITFLPDGAPPDTRQTRINRILTYRGLSVYQGIEFGHAFFVEITTPEGRSAPFQLLFQHQTEPGKASYNDFRDVLGGEYLLRGKYFIDAQKRSLLQVDPLLVLRIDVAGRELGQVPLRLGEEGRVGQFLFRLHRLNLWSRLIFVRITGISLVFSGFAIIILGGVLHYFLPPRQVTARPLPEGGTAFTWQATRFALFYRDEYARLHQALTNGEEHG